MTFYKFFLCLLLPFSFATCTINKRYYGNYYNKLRYWGDMFILNQDSTFVYTCRSNNQTGEFFDSSSGKFSIHKDTISLAYLYHLAYPYLSDNPGDSLLWKITDPHGPYGHRPQKLYWRRKKLYYVSETGEVLFDKEHHMQWRKGIAPNLRSWDRK